MLKNHETFAPAEWKSIVEVFSAHASRRPDALAVEAQGNRRSYAELAARVDVFAARLATLLTGPDQPGRLIGVCLARDVDLPAWLLAILKIGCAYFPIDPTIPAIRLANMLEDARPALIVASRRYANIVAQVDAPVIIAEDEDDVVSPSVPAYPVRPDTLAYVIFTSGSTGRPKGVEIEHGSLVALMATMAVSPGFAEGERMLGLTRISFDLSVPDMFLPFYAGGSLALVDGDVAADPERLAAAFDAYRPDLAQGTPSTWRALLEGGWQGQPALRILAGGEAVTRALADRLLPRCAALWNMYGPTEATVWATAGRIEAGGDAVSIGYPMAGASVLVADDTQHPLPVGEVGEIVIGGIGVARGYRNRPDLSAERFVTLKDGTRAYRTGDLGRVDQSGAIFCLGRLDDQVKVRGFRIELTDVEAALALHPAVSWCAVRLWTDASGDPVLAGHIVPRPGATPSAREVKSFLATQLASYMIPDRIVTISTMPLTPNGKVDRAALTDPFANLPTSATTEVYADVDTMTRLAAIWCELLQVATIDEQDDFFDLGGYSLMTVRLTRRIEADFGLKLALIELMQHSTLAAMAARIEQGDTALDAAAMRLNAPALANPSTQERPPLFWLDAGPLMRTMARGLSPDQPAYALNTDMVDEDALGAGDLSIPEIAARLRMQLLLNQPTGPYYLGGWCRWGIVAYELAQQLIDRGETVSVLVMLDSERPGMRSARPGLRTYVKSWLRSIRPAPVPEEPASFSQRVEIATRSYVARPYAGDVILLRPEESHGDAGWRPLVQGELQIERVPGDHVSMVRGASVQMLAAKLDRALLAIQHKWAPIQAEQDQATQAIAG